MARGRDGYRHFRFRWGETGTAVMSRFKFVGELFFQSLGFLDYPRVSLAAARWPRKRCLKAARLSGEGAPGGFWAPVIFWFSVGARFKVCLFVSSRVVRL